MFVLAVFRCGVVFFGVLLVLGFWFALVGFFGVFFVVVCFWYALMRVVIFLELDEG